MILCMARKKRRRFAELVKMDNVVDGRRSERGWFEKIFGLQGAVLLELGCGRGEYTLALARSRPERGALGVDRNGGRLWKGARAALDEGLVNAVFLRSPIEYLEDHVPPGRVGEIWLPFPDPLPKNRQARHRLLAPLFLERYRRLLCPGGSVHLRTDDAGLVDFAEQSVRAVGGGVLAGVDGVTDSGDGVAAVQTTYEKRYRAEGRTIYERAFRLD
jgi:tRNA (guanine-N7-)-methyltransferase